MALTPTMREHIAAALECALSAITDVESMSKGLTNHSYSFWVNGQRYVYRDPGKGTEQIINRQAEALALKLASELGIDDTLVAVDPEQGWKISRYVEGRDLDYADADQVAKAMELARRLHRSEADSPWSFDFYSEAQHIAEILHDEGYTLPQDFRQLDERVGRLAELMASEAVAPVLCHNDFYAPNFIVSSDGSIRLVDWEYAAMGDPYCDLGNFIAQGSGYSVGQSLEVLDMYLERKATPDEQCHFLSAVAVVGWYWYVWSMFKEHTGHSTDEWMNVWLDAARTFTAAAEEAICDTEVTENEAAGLLENVSALPATTTTPPSLTQAQFDVLVKRYENATATPQDLAALEPYRAKRAVLLASGFGSRMLPITINTPKPLVNVNGRRIIETILDALDAIGVEEIHIVTGYLFEQFELLAVSRPGIELHYNPAFAETNNISSAVLAKDYLRNAYVFESDLFLRNPQILKPYHYESCYYGVPVDSTPDWSFESAGGYVTNLQKGGSGQGCYHMFGISYWTATDGDQLAKDLQNAYDDESNRQRFWDDVPCVIARDHYHIRIKPITFDDIAEIDSFAELQQIDVRYCV